MPLKHRSSPACSCSLRRVLVALQGSVPWPPYWASCPVSPPFILPPCSSQGALSKTQIWPCCPCLKPCQDSPRSSLLGLALALQHHVGSFPSGTLSTILLSPVELPHAPPLHLCTCHSLCLGYPLLSHLGDKLPLPFKFSFPWRETRPPLMCPNLEIQCRRDKFSGHRVAG